MKVLDFLPITVFFLVIFGCWHHSESVIKDELRPTTFEELVAMSREQMRHVDIGRMNLICFNEALPSDDVDIEQMTAKLDEWADHCRKQEVRFRKSFEKNPKHYDGSYAKFKAINLVLTIKEDFKCKYQMSLVESGVMANIHSPSFFKDPNDAFISGLLQRHRGTGSSYPVLIVALGRRLGYPISIKTTVGHMFCEWNDGTEWFNIDTNGEGVDTPPDDWYITGKIGEYGARWASEKSDYFMRPLDNWECLGLFIETLGYCYEANGRMKDALQAYKLALRYLPHSRNLQRLASRRMISGDCVIQGKLR